MRFCLGLRGDRDQRELAAFLNRAGRAGQVLREGHSPIFSKLVLKGQRALLQPPFLTPRSVPAPSPMAGFLGLGHPEVVMGFRSSYSTAPVAAAAGPDPTSFMLPPPRPPGRSSRQVGWHSGLTLGWVKAASSRAFQYSASCTALVSFLSHAKARRAGEIVALGDHSCGEAAPKCGGDSAPVGRVAGVPGPRRPGIHPLNRLPTDLKGPFLSLLISPQHLW